MSPVDAKTRFGRFIGRCHLALVCGVVAITSNARGARAEERPPSADDANKIPLSDITSDSSLIDWRLSAGISIADFSNSSGAHWGSSLRALVGPHVTDSFRPGFEVGGRFYESATYLEFSLVPSIEIGKFLGMSLDVNPVLGASLASLKRGVLDNGDSGHYGNRFQLQGGGELSVWRSVGESKEPSITERGISRMGELASDYRNQCLSAETKTTEACSVLADLINRYRQIIARSADTDCGIPLDLLTPVSEKSTITADILNKIDVCRFLAKERSSNDSAKPRAGGAIRIAHTSGRDLPSATTYEFRLGISF